MSSFRSDFMAGYDDEYARNRVENEDKMRDAYRSRLVDQYQKVGDNISQVLQSGQIFDPTTNAMRPITPEEKQQLAAATGKVNEYVKNLYNPSFDPSKGMVPTDPIHGLLSKLHLMKPVAKPAAQQMSDLNEIRQKYSPSAGQDEAQKFAQQQAQGDAAWQHELKVMEAAGMSPEEIKEVTIAKFGGKGAIQHPTWKLYKLPTGEMKYFDINRPDDIPDGSEPVTTSNKPGTSAFAKYSSAYARFHNIKEDELTPADMDYIRQRMAWDNAHPTSTTTVKMLQNDEHQWVPVTETNQHGIGAPPPDPRESKGSEGDRKPIGEKKKDIKSIRDKHSAGVGNVRVGEPIMNAPNPTTKKAEDDVVAARKLLSVADQVAAQPNDAINQKRLAVALERMSAGRFTTQALDYVIKAGWGNTLEQWANNPSTGALPADVIRQLVDGARQNYKAAQDALSEAKSMNSVKPTDGAPSPKGSEKVRKYNPDTDELE